MPYAVSVSVVLDQVIDIIASVSNIYDQVCSRFWCSTRLTTLLTVKDVVDMLAGLKAAVQAVY